MKREIPISDPVAIKNALPISPLEFGTWPGENQSYIYWLARRKFSLPTKPLGATLWVVADRHYEVFINGIRVASQRNYFNGDRYLYLQRHLGASTLAALKEGDNIVEFLVRSDAFKNKNYLYCHPLLCCELSFSAGIEQAAISSDATWEIAVLEDWRALQALSLTHAFEVATLIPEAKSGVRGTAKDIIYKEPFVLDSKVLPPIYEWTDYPSRIDTHRPKGVLSSGSWAIKTDSLCFNLSEVFNVAAETPMLQAVCHLPERTRITIATSALSSCSFEVDGEEIFNRDWLPGRDLMAQKNYLSPLSAMTLEAGEHRLAFHFGDEHRRFLPWQERYADSPNIAGLWFRLQLHGLDAATLVWRLNDDRPILPHPLNCTIAEALSARSTVCPLKSLTVKESADSFSIVPAEKNEKQFVTLAYAGLKKGRLSFRICAASAGRIYLSYGILADEGAIDCARNNKNAVEIVDVPAGISRYEAFEDRTFVFLDLACEGFTGKFEINDITLDERIFLDDSAAYFESADAVMNALWRASIRTAQICCDEIYMDNFEREHCQWLCSAPPNLAAGYYFFAGNRHKADKVLQEFALQQKPTGELQGHAPGFWGDRPAYQCHVGLYVRAVWRNYRYHGNRKMLAEMLPVLKKILAYWETYRNSAGLLENIHTVWVDWGIHFYSYAPVGKKRYNGVLTAMNGYYLGALRMVSELAAEVNDQETAARCSILAAQTAQSMGELLFNQERNLFRDGLGNPAEENFSQQANIVCALYGVFPQPESRAILQTAFGQPGTRADIIAASPHFVLLTGEALFEAGLDCLAWQWLYQHQRMLAAPAGTIWEAWSPQVCYCQGTGSAIAYHLARYHAGVYPAKPGFAAIGIRPYSCGQKRLKAGLNTHFGLIGVEWERSGDRFNYHLSLPPALRDRETTAPPEVQLTVDYF